MARSGRAGERLLLAGAGLLLVSLFLAWSHQFSPAFLARYGTSDALRGVPRDPDAWQLFSVVDVLLALLAGALGLVAALGPRASRAVRAWLVGAVALATAFSLHALAAPPTNGATIFDPTRHGYAPDAPGAGVGETVALIGLAVATAGLLASLARR